MRRVSFLMVLALLAIIVLLVTACTLVIGDRNQIKVAPDVDTEVRRDNPPHPQRRRESDAPPKENKE